MSAVGNNGLPAPITSVEIGGINPLGELQPLQTDSNGNLKIALTVASIEIGTVDQGAPGAQPWLVTAYQGTNPWVVSGTLAVTQSGTWNINDILGTISLPTGASTSANQTNNLQTTQLVNAAGNAVAIKTLASTPLGTDYGLETNSLMYGLTTAGGGGYVPVKVNPSGTVLVDASGSTVPVSQSGTWNINNISGTISLPTGASTLVAQNTGNASLASIDSKLTNPFPISGTVAATQSGAWTTGRTWTLASGTDSIAAVQSGTWNVNNISGTISLPTGAATENTLALLNAKFGSLGQKAMTGSAPVVIASDQSAIHTIVDSGTISATQGTSPWVSNITQFGSVNLSTGTGASGTGIPRVTVANDSNILATQSGTWNINNISGTITLPTGAATSANQTTELASLASIDSKLGTLGQKTMTGSAPVVLASDQSGINTFLDHTAITQNITGINGTVSVNTNGCASVGVQITGTWTGTLQLQGTTDGTNFFSILFTDRGGNAATITSTTSNIAGKIGNVAGCTSFRVFASAFASGTAVVSIAASAGSTAQPINTNLNNFFTASFLQSGSAVVGKVGIDQTTPGTTNLVSAGQNGTWTVQPGNTANTTAWLVTQEKSSTSAVTSVASSATNVNLLASNSARKGAMFYNDSNQNLYLKLGTTASTSSYTILLTAGAFFELPDTRIYTGNIDGIWASANGNARITELT